MKRWTDSLITLIIVLSLFLPFATIMAQEEIILNECLVLKVPENYYRTPVGIDPVEAILIKGQTVTPKEGGQVEFPDKNVAGWEKAKTDNTGWIQPKALRNGYAYFSYESAAGGPMILEGMGHEMVYVNGVPRAGNRYQYKETWEPWEPKFNYSLIPVQLQPGRNDLLFLCSRSGRIKVKLHPVTDKVFFNENDLTLPDLIVGQAVEAWGAIVIVNASQEPLRDLLIRSAIDEGNAAATNVPAILPMSVRKIGFRIQCTAVREKGTATVNVQLLRKSNDKEQLLKTVHIPLRVVASNETHKITFISEIDGSVQYFAVNPAQQNPQQPKALVLSVHGAAVEALNQANAYQAKTWAHIVAPTNRRPYGFNWEDWGRLDALEVIDLAQKTLNIDAERVYLTGHSMGGHGTWILGALYPDQFAALGPSAGWLSFWSYRVRDDMDNESAIQQFMRRVTLPSRTLDLAKNYQNLGLYIIHGSDDDNVQVEQSRQMVDHLSKFHRDFIYWEQPKAGHWWDNSDEPGADCVDWPPLFDFFDRHTRHQPGRLRQVEFMTPNPGITSHYYWLGIEAQIKPLIMSSAKIQFDPGKNRFTGTTVNVARISLDIKDIRPISPCLVELDSQKVENVTWAESDSKLWFERIEDKWMMSAAPSSSLKGPHRYGMFKDAFRHHMVFVYGTNGKEAENDWAVNKARYDAEVFWYQGNGSIDVIADKEFDAKKYPDQNIILYGHSKSNSAWRSLLGGSPVQVDNGSIKIGSRKIKGDDLACFFIRPRPGSDIACVGAVSASGLVGMRLTNNRSYLSPGYAFPDVTVFDRNVFIKGTDGIICAGFFGLDWQVESGEFVWRE